MASLKEIRERRTSVASTMQITSAMKMVSAAKLKKAQDAIVQFRPYAEKLQEILASVDIPRIHFGVGTGELLQAMSEAGSEVMGVDYRVAMDTAAQRVNSRVLQGNLDPALLFAGDDAVRHAVRTIRGEVERAQQRGDIDTHIWNLGHGVLPTTDAEAITRAVSIIHEEG